MGPQRAWNPGAGGDRRAGSRRKLGRLLRWPSLGLWLSARPPRHRKPRQPSAQPRPHGDLPWARLQGWRSVRLPRSWSPLPPAPLTWRESSAAPPAPPLKSAAMRLHLSLRLTVSCDTRYCRDSICDQLRLVGQHDDDAHDERHHHLVSPLSGPTKQRLAIARAFRLPRLSH